MVYFNILCLVFKDAVHAGRIIGGREAKAHSRPYMALIEKEKENKICGGSLVSEDFVLTAAHCKSPSGLGSYKVYLGLHDYNDRAKAQNLEVEQEFMRDDYNASTFQNDILLLKLSSKANLNCDVQLISLAGPEDPAPGSCSISGWGRFDLSSSNPSPKLREVNVTLSKERDCQTDDLYCCEGGKGSVQGDSGGPLVCENEKVYGVVSTTRWVSINQPTNYYFSKIPKYKDWIDSIIKNK